MAKNLLYDTVNSKKIARTTPLSLLHPDGTRRTFSYYIPSIFREYALQFPKRVESFLSNCTPDRYNENALDSEINSIQQVGEQVSQRLCHYIHQLNTSNLAEINEEISQIDCQIHDIDNLLSKL